MTDSVPIEQLTIDEVNFVVADLPDQIQAAVRKYEEWRDRYVLAQDEVQLVASALRDLGAQIVAGVRAAEQEKANAEAEAKTEAKTEAEVEAETATEAEAMTSEGAPAVAPVVVEAPVTPAVPPVAVPPVVAPAVPAPVGETLVVDDAS